MDRSEEVYWLFEGGCPHDDCQLEGGRSKDTRVIRIGGTATFMDHHGHYLYPYHVERHVWDWDNHEAEDDNCGQDDDGYVVFVCDAGHEYSAHHSRRTGEWL